MGNTQNKLQNWASTFRVLASAARTADAATSYFPNTENARGVRVYIETTASSSPSTTFSIQVKDPLNNVYHSVLTSAAVTGNGRVALEVYPGGAAVANLRSTYHIGRGFRVIGTAGNGNSHTYNMVGEWLP